MQYCQRIRVMRQGQQGELPKDPPTKNSGGLKNVCRINRLNPYLVKLRTHPQAGEGTCATFLTRDGWPIYYRSWGPDKVTKFSKIIL